MPPITMLIKPVSGLCNMRCKYCFYADVTEHRDVKSYGMMSTDTLEAIVRKALFYADGVCSFGFQGGEPTLAGLDFYEKLIELQKLYNYKNVRILNSIQTNGYNISDELSEFLARHHFLVGLSIDGTRETHNLLRLDSSGEGTFDRICETARLFDKHGVEFNILCVVNGLVAQEPDRVYSALKKYRYLQFIPCIDPFDGQTTDFSLTAEKYSIFLRALFDRYYSDFMSGNYVSIRNFDNYISLLLGQRAENCAMNGVCTCYFLIEADGSVYPCDFYVLDEWKIGNINTDSFAKMLKSENALNFVEVSKRSDPACLDCKWNTICRGGCRRDREPMTDGVLSLNKYCSAYKEFFEYSYDRMKEIAEKVSRSTKV